MTGKTSSVTLSQSYWRLFDLALKGAVEDAACRLFQVYLAVSIVAIATILLLSLFFTHKWRRVLRPLKALSNGARRVESGDLSEPIIHRVETNLRAS